jgi:FtsP/CotA-like multicopper oxidase with cupredoxin domain
MKLTRRKALKLGLTGSGMLLSPFALPKPSWAADLSKCKQPLPLITQTPPLSPQKITPFQQPLHIPEVLQPALKKSFPRKIFNEATLNQCQSGKQESICATTPFQQEFDYYEITMRKQPVELVPAQGGEPAINALFWLYQGNNPKPAKPTVLGPLIRQKKGRAACVRFINQLGNDDKGDPICTSVHLHGMASLPQYDGYAEDLTMPGQYKDYYYPNNRASILWYHDHAVHKTSRNVYMGLAGMYIVEYDEDDFCDRKDHNCLPSGDFEIPLILQDKTFEECRVPASEDCQLANSWRLVFNDRQQRGVYADLILINGTPFPHLKVKRRKYYFRLLNASASRTFQLTLSGDPIQLSTQNLTQDGKPVQLTVIATDAGLLAEPVHRIAPGQDLRIGVAERYGVIIDFSVFRPEVKHVYLRNSLFSSNLGPHAGALMRFDIEDGEVDDPSYIPAKLGKLTVKEEMDTQKLRTRTFRFGRGRDWVINGKTWDHHRVDANPGQCDLEVWNLINTGGWTHPVHIHLIDFQILDRNGQKPQPYEEGWKDVVLLQDFETVRVVARFGPHRGKYMMHCHNIVHEDHDMMTQFEIGKGGADPMSDPSQDLPATPLGEKEPPLLIEECLPCQCFTPIPNHCHKK